MGRTGISYLALASAALGTALVPSQPPGMSREVLSSSTDKVRREIERLPSASPHSQKGYDLLAVINRLVSTAATLAS